MIPFSTSDNNLNSHFVSFLQNTKKYKFYTLEDFLEIKKSKIFFIKQDFEKKGLKNFLLSLEKHQVQLVLSNENLKDSFFDNFNKVCYPVDLRSLEKKFLFYKNNFFSYKELLLRNENLLVNIKNNQKIYITETEFSIMKLLITEKSVKKDIIKKNILNLNEEIDTKSLDSHLSRIRKKMKEIGLLVDIVPVNIKEIKIN